ncbi:MAG TPA: response regulator [Nitrososphaeraceae archaeon]|nr:response regulator [Nitrososphaeraceae archaeon]
MTSSLPSQSSKRRILVVDNEKDITVALQVGLEDGGFDVDTFNDPSLALKNFKPNYYDLVLIDIVMPDIDGFDLYERLKKIDPDIKACFLTASEMYHEEFRTSEHCALDKDLFLQKPISNDDLIMEINRKISLHNSNREVKLGPFPNDDNNGT